MSDRVLYCASHTASVYTIHGVVYKSNKAHTCLQVLYIYLCVFVCVYLADTKPKFLHKFYPLICRIYKFIISICICSSSVRHIIWLRLKMYIEFVFLLRSYIWDERGAAPGKFMLLFIIICCEFNIHRAQLHYYASAVYCCYVW